jgi:hypothetical protein
MGSMYDKLRKQSGPGVTKKKGKQDEERKRNPWNEEGKSRIGKEAAKNMDGSLIWRDCEGEVCGKSAPDERSEKDWQ